jgi:NadR type nicotinamide-nucleotide adenylyltransferase
MTARRSEMLPACVTESYIGALRIVMLKVVITGPECSGKTTLAEALAKRFNTLWVHEGARSYLDTMPAGQAYNEATLLEIAKYQLQLEDLMTAAIKPGDPQLLFCDTDLITIRIWGEEKYGRSDPWIVQRTEQRPYGLWLLSSPDMPWESDPLRENPHDRDRLFSVYERTLRALRKPYIVLQGPPEQRLQEATAAVQRMHDRIAAR